MKGKIPSISALLCLGMTLLLLSCDKNPFSHRIKEGVITYNIEYPSIKEDNIMLEMMPRKMEMAFKDDNYRTDIIAGMGLFKSSIIFKKGDDKITHSVKMLRKKYAAVLDQKDIKKINPELADIEIEYTGNKKEIAGFKCKEAILKQASGKSYILYYTDDINIKTPNKNTPFEEIGGVLMQYEIVNYNTHMKFTVEEVIEKEVNSIDLVLEDGYKMVEPEVLDKEIQAIFDKVN